MATAIVEQSTPTINLAATAISWLQEQHERVTVERVEKMCVELDQLIRLGVEEFEDVELRYAFMVAQAQPVGWDDLPACLWP
jgi:hypothetical protein